MSARERLPLGRADVLVVGEARPSRGISEAAQSLSSVGVTQAAGGGAELGGGVSWVLYSERVKPCVCLSHVEKSIIYEELHDFKKKLHMTQRKRVCWLLIISFVGPGPIRARALAI